MGVQYLGFTITGWQCKVWMSDASVNKSKVSCREGEEERRRKCKEIGSGALIKGIQFILVDIQKSANYICVKKIINEAFKRNFLREDHRIGFN